MPPMHSNKRQYTNNSQNRLPTHLQRQGTNILLGGYINVFNVLVICCMIP